MRRCGWSGHRRGAGDGSPGGEAFRSGLAVGGGGQAVAAWAEVAGDRAVGGEEALGVPRALAAPHPPLALPRGLMGVLGAIVQALMAPVLHAG